MHYVLICSVVPSSDALQQISTCASQSINHLFIRLKKIFFFFLLYCEVSSEKQQKNQVLRSIFEFPEYEDYSSGIGSTRICNKMYKNSLRILDTHRILVPKFVLYFLNIDKSRTIIVRNSI